MKCDTCGKPVRVADGLHSGSYRHDDDTPNAAAEWCETEAGYVRVTVSEMICVPEPGEDLLDHTKHSHVPGEPRCRDRR